MNYVNDRWDGGPEDLRLEAQENLILEVTEGIYQAMERLGVTKAALADRLDKSRSYVSQVLSRDRNMTLRTVADFAWALDVEIAVRFLTPGTGFTSPDAGVRLVRRHLSATPAKMEAMSERDNLNELAA